MRLGLELASDAGVPSGRVGVLTHYAAVDSQLRLSLDLISSLPGSDLRAVFGPQHGFYGQTQDNMIEWEGQDSGDCAGVPLHSLYGRVRKPTPEMLKDLDVLFVDLQDVGSRYYTYVYTMALSMRACAEAGIPVVVLDRPNPLGLDVAEGAILDPDYSSFVGMYPIPARHGLTIGEEARLFAALDGIPRPQVVTMKGWNGHAGWPKEIPWVPPSPNMPTPDTALVYPGMCLLEGTNISEGRGTTRPFEIFGAPWVDSKRLADELNGSLWLEGARLRPHEFIPTFGKHSGQLCRGAQLHVTDPVGFRPYRAGLGILAALWRFEGSAWKEPPYEYEYGKMPIDILTGGSRVREAVEAQSPAALERLATTDMDAWSGTVSEHLLYEREAGELRG